MQITIPGRGSIGLDQIVLDFNGTLATDGQVPAEVVELLGQVSQRYPTYLVTADTFGTAVPFAERLGIPWRIVKTGEDKAHFIASLNGGVAAVGNGANDGPMFRAAALAIAVVGPEGAAVAALLAADVVAPTIQDALQLLLSPARLIATLRI